MGIAEIIQILQLADLATQVAVNIGVDAAKLHAMQTQARSEGRSLNATELQALAADAHAAVNAIGAHDAVAAIGAP